MTSESAYCLSRENRILDEKTINNRYDSPIVSRFEKVWREITGLSSRENRTKTNNKQQISLGNFNL